MKKIMKMKVALSIVLVAVMLYMTASTMRPQESNYNGADYKKIDDGFEITIETVQAEDTTGYSEPEIVFID